MLLLSATPIRAILYAALWLASGTAQGAGWTFDGIHGTTSVMALPGGQVTLVLDGAGQQARAITYTPADGTAPASIARTYGPGERKAIESENGATRHHVYGAGLAPIMRTDSDGGFTYQAGLETIVVDGAGTATVVHRVTDLKHSTVAVLGNPGRQPGQRVSYTSLGRMRTEKAGIDPDTMAALLAAYEGLTVLLLHRDQLADNRARQYDPASGRFLALDLAGQAIAYEARGNNPVSRVDPDGNVNFDQLIAALKQDRSIAVGFGDMHDSQDMPSTLFYFLTRLQQEGIPFHIFQETNLLAYSPATDRMVNTRYLGSPLFLYLLDLLIKGLITDLGIPHAEVDAEQAAEIKAAYTPREAAGNYRIFQCHFDMWEHTIPAARSITEKYNVVPIFFMGANHFPNFESALHRYPLHIHGTNKVSEHHGNVSLVPLSSFGMQSKYGLVTVYPNQFANVIRPGKSVLATMDFRFEAGTMLPLPYQVQIPEQAFMKHKALIPPYSQELLIHLDSKMKLMAASAANANQNNDSDEKKEEEESDEKNDTDNPHRNRRASVPPVTKPDSASFISEFDEK